MIKKHAHEQLTSFTGVTVKLRGVYKQLGGPDLYPNERKLHFFLNAGTPESLRQAMVILQHCYTTGFMVAQPRSSLITSLAQQQPQQMSYYAQPQQHFQQVTQLQPQHQNYAPSQFIVPSLAQLQPQVPSQQQRQYASQESQLLQASPAGLLNLQQNLFIYGAKVSLGALAGQNVSHPGFSVKGRILGPQGQNVKHITTMTGAKVQLKGRGATQFPEADGLEDMHIDINASSEISLKKAVELSTNLIETVRQEYVTSVTKPLHFAAPTTPINHAGQPHGAILPSYFQTSQSVSQGFNNITANLIIGSGNAPSFQPPPPMFSAPPKNFEPASGLKAPIHSQSYNNIQSQKYEGNTNSAIFVPMANSKAGCVPFLYPDSDGVVNTIINANIIDRSESSPPSLPSHTGPSRLNTIMLNGGIHHQNHNVATAAHSFPVESSSITTNSSNSSSSRDNHANNYVRVSNSDSNHNNSSSGNTDRNDSKEASTGSNKRRRGFQESTVYTAPTDCPLPKSRLQPPTIISVLAPVAGSSRDSPTGIRGRPSNTSFEEAACPDSTALAPSACVITALAAMTERRLQNKILRPLVPTFSSHPIDRTGAKTPDELPVKPIVPLFSSNTKPLVPSFLSNAKQEINVQNTTTTSESESSFKLPGLTAYEDEDDE